MEEAKQGPIKRKRENRALCHCSVKRFFEAVLNGEVDFCTRFMPAMSINTYLCVDTTGYKLWLSCSPIKSHKVDRRTLHDIIAHSSESCVDGGAGFTILLKNWFDAVLRAFPESNAHMLTVALAFQQDEKVSSVLIRDILMGLPPVLCSKLVLTALGQGYLLNKRVVSVTFKCVLPNRDSSILHVLLQHCDKLHITERVLQENVHGLFAYGDVQVIRRALSYNIPSEDYMSRAMCACLENKADVLDLCVSKFAGIIKKNPGQWLIRACAYGHVDPFVKIGCTYANSWNNVRDIGIDNVEWTEPWLALSATYFGDYPRIVTMLLGMFHPKVRTKIITSHIGTFCWMGPKSLHAALSNVSFSGEWDRETRQKISSPILSIIHELKVKHLLVYLQYFHDKLQVSKAVVARYLCYVVIDRHVSLCHSTHENSVFCEELLNFFKVIAVLFVYDMIKLSFDFDDPAVGILKSCVSVVQTLVEQVGAGVLYQQRQALRSVSSVTHTKRISNGDLLERVFNLCDTLSCQELCKMTETQ